MMNRLIAMTYPVNTVHDFYSRNISQLYWLAYQFFERQEASQFPDLHPVHSDYAV